MAGVAEGASTGKGVAPAAADGGVADGMDDGRAGKLMLALRELR